MRALGPSRRAALRPPWSYRAHATNKRSRAAAASAGRRRFRGAPVQLSGRLPEATGLYLQAIELRSKIAMKCAGRQSFTAGTTFSFSSLSSSFSFSFSSFSFSSEAFGGDG